jgi:hypothetical protein
MVLNRELGGPCRRLVTNPDRYPSLSPAQPKRFSHSPPSELEQPESVQLAPGDSELSCQNAEGNVYASVLGEDEDDKQIRLRQDMEGSRYVFSQSGCAN